MFCIEIVGDSKVIIENVKSILEYENESVRVDIETHTVNVKGNALTLNNYTDNVMVISGIIQGVLLE